MPISEATPTTKAHLHPLPLLPAPNRVNSEKKRSPSPGQLSVMQSGGDWEEPHPGQRFSFPPARNAGGCIPEHHHAIMGAHNKIGMAAKYSPYSGRTRSFGPRRLIQARLRPTSFRALRIPSINRHNPTSPPPYTPQSNAPSTTPIFKRPASIEFAQTNMDVDAVFDEATDTDGCSRPLSCAIETVTSSALSSPQLSVTDFSNHLNIAFERGSFDRSRTNPGHNSKSYFHLPTPEGDPYGWEAELTKKLTCSELEFRTAGGQRKSLLHRVFSLGPRGVS